jgi:hypothetical protein
MTPMRRHRLAAAALLGAALLALVPRAPAAPFTGHFVDLISEMNDRDLALPIEDPTPEQRRERRVVNRFFAFLAADSQDVLGDVKMARKMAVVLEAGYPDDGLIVGLLSALNDDLRGEIEGVAAEVELTLAVADAGRLRDRAEAKLVVAAAILADADAALTQALRARLQEKCLKTILAANRLAVRAGPGDPGSGSFFTALVDGSGWQSNGDFGTAVSGSADVSTGNGGVRKVSMSGRRIEPSNGEPNLPGDTTRLVMTFTSNNENIVPATYSIGTSNGVNASATWFEEPEAGGFVQAVAVSGTITITSLDINLGSIDLEGTFDLSMYDAANDVTFPIASGSFTVLGLPRESVP